MSEPVEPTASYTYQDKGIPPQYIRLWDEHNLRPVPEGTWESVIALAKKEEESGVAKQGIYGEVPLESLLTLAQKVRQEQDPLKRYGLVAEIGPTGKLWFDILIGFSNEETIQALSRTINKRTWNKGLDIGAGTGNLSQIIEKHCTNLIAVDQADFLLNVARTRQKTEKTNPLHVVVTDALRLPFKENSFDLITSHGLTSAFTKKELYEFTREIARALASGGSYFDTFAAIPPNDLALFEKRSLANAKGILADLIVDAVSGSGSKNSSDQVSGREFLYMFTDKGLSLKFHDFPELHALVLEFSK